MYFSKILSKFVLGRDTEEDFQQLLLNDMAYHGQKMYLKFNR